MYYNGMVLIIAIYILKLNIFANEKIVIFLNTNE